MLLRVLDNGPGIIGLSIDDIWLPGRSSRRGGTGLGLTIVRDTAADLGGRAYAVPKGELGGAEFLIELPLAQGRQK
jgi:C4-dicarboxylate-specific signal transduction histidine kinase